MKSNVSGDLASSLGNSGQATDDITILELPGFSKVFNDEVREINETIFLDFAIDNSSNPIEVTGLDFTDNLPAGMVVDSGAQTNTCTGGTLTAVPGSSVISYTGGAVPANSSCFVSIRVTGTTLGLKSNVSGDLTSSLGNSGTASDDIVIVESPGFTKAFGAFDLGIGMTTSLTFIIDNGNNSVDLGPWAFTDDLPAGLEFATPSNLSTDCVGGVLATPTQSQLSYDGFHGSRQFQLFCKCRCGGCSDRGPIQRDIDPGF